MQTVKLQERGNRRLGVKLMLLCQCGRREVNSGPLINNGYEVNGIIALVMHLLGIGRGVENKIILQAIWIFVMG